MNQAQFVSFLQTYESYHRDPRNKFFHFLGIPTVIFSLLLALAWIRFTVLGLEISAATAFCLAVLVYYFWLEPRIALMVTLPVGGLLLAASLVANLPGDASVVWFWASFVLGWIFQLTGHYFEGKRPALVDNFFQIFAAPLFLAVEVCFLLGLRHDLKMALQ